MKRRPAWIWLVFLCMEVWKDIPNYEGMYQVSNLGRVKSLKRKGVVKDKVLKTNSTCSGGYRVVNLCKEVKRIHVLVAMAFLNHEPNGHGKVVDHIDSNKLNNNVDNLQLITHRENVSKDSLNSSGYVGVFLRPSGRFIARIQIGNDYRNLGTYDTAKEAAEIYQEELKKINI